MILRYTLPSLALAALVSGTAAAGTDRVWVGDPTNGKKLYQKECGPCHGDDGNGGRSGVSLRDSGRLNLIVDDEMIAVIKTGKGLKRPGEHKLEGKLGFLEQWDVVAYTRSLHQTLADFFPEASRYVSKSFEIDAHGIERIEKATGGKPKDTKAAVFTFFTFDGEPGRLSYVPQDPIKLDQLKKNLKSGYLVFLPIKTEGYNGEVGVGMDKDGKITRMAVQAGTPGADLMNKSLSRFVGMGKKGLKDPFKVGGGKTIDQVSKDVFATYMSAMETVTMYDREENERTWADD